MLETHMNKKGTLLIVMGSLAALAIGQAITGNMKLNINGKAVAGQTLVSKGQVYVPLSALRSAGVTASAKSGTLFLGLAPAGGANQVQALEGKIGDWLFNGIWRFRVLDVVPNDDGRAGWKVKVELRNGTKLDNVALDGTGYESLTLVMADANALKPYNITDFVRPVGQGSSISVDLIFYDDEGNGRLPEKLIIRISPDSATRTYLKNQGASYTVGDPSFRVSLKKG